MGVAMVLLTDESGRAAPVWQVAAAGVGYWAVTAALSRTGSALALKALLGGTTNDVRTVRRQAVVTVATRLWLVAGLGGLIWLGYGRWITHDLGLARWPLVGRLAAVAPFVVALMLNWIIEYPLHRVSRLRLAGTAALMGHRPVPVWTLREYLANNTRHHLLFILVPIAIIVLLADALELYVRPMLAPETSAWAVPVGSMVAAFGVFLVAPLIIVRIWRTERLADGPLRRDLEAMCRRMGLRFREILVWKSGGVIANAGVVGLLPAVRYVLLSDALLAEMSPKHIRAIFAHEAGHVVHKHILFSVMFVLVAVTFSSLATEVLMRLADLSLWQGEMVALSLVAMSFAVGFGWVSRRFERQSDVMAAWVSSQDDDVEFAGDVVTPRGAAVMADALEAVAGLNGMRTGARNWRHGSIAWRVSYVLWLGNRYGSRQEIGCVVRRIKLVLVAGLVLMAVLVAWQGLLYQA